MWAEDAISSGSPRTSREAGVDIEAGQALVEALKPLARATARPGSEAALGGFGHAGRPPAPPKPGRGG